MLGDRTFDDRVAAALARAERTRRNAAPGDMPPDEAEYLASLTSDAPAMEPDLHPASSSPQDQPPRRMAEASPESGWPEPDPLCRPPPTAGPFPLACLGPVLEPAAKAIASTVQAADSVVASSLLAAASVAASPHFDVEADGRRSPIVLWFMTVAASGERKSAVDSLAIHEHDAIECEAARSYAGEVAEHKARMAEHAAAEKKARSEAPGALPRPEPEAPLLPWIMTREPTVEGLHKLLAGGRGFVGILSDDAGDFFGGHSMAKDHRVRTVAALSSLWDRGRFDRVRGGDGSSKYWGRRMSMHLMIQPVIAESVASDALLSGQGFLPRCLLAWPAERAGTRRYIERDLTQDPAVLAYWRRMRELLTTPPRVAPGSRNELDPLALRMDARAKALWIDIANAMEAAQRESGPLHPVRPWASKGAEQVLRVAGVLTAIEHERPTHITAEIIERAGGIVAFYLGEAARIVGHAAVPPQIRAAEALRAWLVANGERVVHSTGLLQRAPRCVRSAAELRQAMTTLETHGWVRQLPPGAIVDGAPRKSAWEVARETD